MRKTLLLLLIAATTLLWALIGYGLGPPLIESAYKGQSYEFFNAMITGQNIHPMSKYLADWQKLRFFSGITLGVFIPTLFVLLPHAKRFSEQRDYHQMNPSRVYLALCVALAITLGSIGCIVFDKEYWPLSNYPMYAKASFEKKAICCQTYLINDDGTETLAIGMFDPMNESIINLAAANHLRVGSIDQFGKDLLELYRIRNQQKIVGIRIYKCIWEIDPWAKNTESPDRELLTETLWSEQ